ncbi:hypothetical protein ACH4E8_01900 [Streptomyces sp. NPDC017979]|uniref:hypothetical protein n=1 Tax=Streptomyces sp. NPDC017979 TaxID=3365024 RepID=UPI0037BCBD0F
MWTERLLAATGREDQQLTLPWERVELALETPLPDDYKRLCEAFGHGTFCHAYELISVGHEESGDILSGWQVYLESVPEPGSEGAATSQYAPYAIYRPGRAGLIPWGAGEAGDEMFWLAGSNPPEAWAILVRNSDFGPGEWSRFDMPVSEFMGRLLLEPDFGPFGIAHAIPQPFFVPEG